MIQFSSKNRGLFDKTIFTVDYTVWPRLKILTRKSSTQDSERFIEKNMKMEGS